MHGRSHEGKVFEKLFIIVNINKNYKCNCRQKGVDNGMECFIMSICLEFGNVGIGTT